MNITMIKTQKPFEGLFPIDEKTLNAIETDMNLNGFDESAPIILWNDIIIDGHTRFLAAKNIGLEDVPVYTYNFDNETTALEYAIHNQRDRRNLTDGDILRCVEVVDNRKEVRGRTKEEKENRIINVNNSTPSHIRTAEIIGISPSTVQKTRTILDYADEETKRYVLDGTKSIHRAAQETQQKRKEQTPSENPTFNKTNDSIEWALWTWNPVTGCKHGCQYCYARDIANRFYKEKFEPTFRPERLAAPKNTKVPKDATTGEKNVFVVSMGDLFGNWVPEDWIEQILNSAKTNPQWNFLFLTKNPIRLLEFKFPSNSWVGTTIDTQARVQNAMDVFSKLKAPVKFFSCEPLQEELTFKSLKMIDWIIIGGKSKSSGEPAEQPKWEWVEKLQFQARKDNVKIYFKPNLQTRPKEYPEL